MKNTFKLIILVAIGITILGSVILYQSPSMTLDQIIKNKDCTALNKWEEEHMFNDNLNISSEQMSGAIKLATECVGKALKNMGGGSDSKTNEYLENMDKDTALVREIIDDRDCWGAKDLIKSGEIDSITLKTIIAGFSKHCDKKAEINDEGIDISGKYDRNYDHLLK